MLKKNTAGQFIYFALINATDGSAHTGQTPTGYQAIDGAAQGAIGGAVTENANGQYEYAPSQGDTNGDEIGYFFVNSGSIPVSITVTTETKKMVDLNDIAAGALMGLANDAITSAKYDESTAFALAYLDDAATQVARVGADGDTLESLSDQIDVLPTDANVTTQCALALSNIHLDHLLGVTYDPAAKPGVSDALLNEIIENDSGVSRFTTNALEQAPGATGDATEAKQDLILEDIVDMKGTAFVKDTHSLVDQALPGALMGLANDAITASKYDESTAFPVGFVDTGATKIARTGADADTLETLSDEIALVPDAAGIESECNDALVALHLDHLLAATYDPASKPGAADALLNELVESDAGVSRYTANALEEAPSGTGGDATAANQVLLLEDLVDIKGSGFVKDTDSMVDLAHIGADADTLETLSDEIAAINTIITFVQNVLEGDQSIDTGTTPWQHVIKTKSTANVLVQKNLKEVDGATNVTAVTQVVGTEIEP